MALLAAAAYDPSTQTATALTSALIAMTAIDTTNLRLTFSVPPNGTVLVRLRSTTKGSATGSPQIMLGVLEGSTVRGRQVPIFGRMAGASGSPMTGEACFLVTGLQPGAALTWDAAYGVEFAVASTAINYGGPNDTTATNACGAFIFEVWETVNLLAGVLYDPATLASKAVTAQLAMTAFDTTNLRVTFTVPSTGRVLVKMRCAQTGGTALGTILLGVLDGATIRARSSPVGGSCDQGSLLATSFIVWEAVIPVTGLTPGASMTWDAAYGVEALAATQNIVYGGPNNTTQADAGGGFAYEIWAA